MDWKEINTSDLPENEVLAANFKVKTYGYTEKLIGYLHINDAGIILCESESEILENCTHYIDMSTYDIKGVE